MPKAAVKALRVMAAHLVQEAELLQRMAREALAEARRFEREASAKRRSTRGKQGSRQRRHQAAARSPLLP
jgi:ABC-type nitrate/sulfonate/bicarbonate transport system substrate-binding protein